MNSPDVSTIAVAEAAWLNALGNPAAGGMRALVHPDFIAVHGPTGQIQTAEDFLNDSEKRPRNHGVQVLESTVREIGDVVTVSGIEEYRVEFVPGATPFVIQAAVSRVWVRGDSGLQLVHLQMARRVTPG